MEDQHMVDEARFWDFLEAAWAPLGAEVDRARSALATRTPAPGEDFDGKPPFAVVDGALDGFLDNLTANSRGLSAEELTAFDRVVERKLHDIDREDVHAVTDGSDDGFLYARGFIVALGRDFYAAVVRDPRTAVLDADCEGMCYFFAHLHRRRFGDFPDTGSGLSRESFSNPAGWLAPA
ncbi:DUF4240 domain-containing protein [Actinomadura xylanilytica]|uniref:DUF4240 domain-containing protein n=1 Tax=Actinomadura xylanilytica TaxID=887459 RepID=UPI00255ADE4B|nr:DUF4240 domain-containing protein [Actinomadura xylanilytica]MDL4776208.1 DUF4240 domain-containing protein [Actinomadura xylanilytica]